MKIIIISLTLITLVTVVIAYGNKSEPLNFIQAFPEDIAGITFVIAFMGWMPAPLDLSVWHSLWVMEKRKDDERFNIKKSLLDFNVGYIGTTVLALFFLSLGALVMYGSGETFSPKGGIFARQLIELYTKTLGQGMGVFVGLAAFITMFSTTITCLDALPRAMSKAHYLITSNYRKQRESDNATTENAATGQLAEVPKILYFSWMAVLIIGSLAILNLFMTNMSSFLKAATILSFLTTPFFAVVNYILVTRYIVKEHQPSGFLRVLSAIGLIYLLLFCFIYIYNL